MENTTVKITLNKSLIGRVPAHVKTAKSLGLNKIGESTVQPDNAATRGKIAKIAYLVTVED